MKQKKSGSLIVDLLIATIIAGIAISVSARLPVMLVKLWQKVQKKINQKSIQHRIVNLLCNDLQTSFIPDLYVSNINLSAASKDGLEQKDSKPDPEENSKNKDLKKKWFFMIKNVNSTQDFLFFVTTNTIPTFTITKPKIAGVFYVLEKISESLFEKNINLRNLKDKNLFRLVRIESPDVLFVEDEFNNAKIKKIIGKRIVVLSLVERFDVEVFGWCKTESDSKLEGKEQNDIAPIELKKTKEWTIKGVSQYTLPAKVKINCKYFNGLLEEEFFEVEQDIFAQYVLAETKSLQDLENEQKKTENQGDNSTGKNQNSSEKK